MESIAVGFGVIWALCGAAAAFMNGKPGLWRITIWLGPLAFFLFPPQTGENDTAQRTTRKSGTGPYIPVIQRGMRPEPNEFPKLDPPSEPPPPKPVQRTQPAPSPERALTPVLPSSSSPKMNIHLMGEVHFHQQEQLSVFTESNSSGDIEKFGEIGLASMFALRLMSNLDVCETTDSMAQFLICADASVVAFAAGKATGGFELLPYPGHGGRKQFILSSTKPKTN